MDATDFNTISGLLAGFVWSISERVIIHNSPVHHKDALLLHESFVRSAGGAIGAYLSTMYVGDEITLALFGAIMGSYLSLSVFL